MAKTADPDFDPVTGAPRMTKADAEAALVAVRANLAARLHQVETDIEAAWRSERNL